MISPMTPEQMEQVMRVIREYPRWDGEGVIHRAARIAVLGGLMERGKATVLGKDEDLKRGAIQPGRHLELVPAATSRLPYRDDDREPGSDDV